MTNGHGILDQEENPETHEIKMRCECGRAFVGNDASEAYDFILDHLNEMAGK